MKRFGGTLPVIILLCAVALSQGQNKKKSSSEEDDNEGSRKPSSSVGGMRGTCSCRDMQAQMEHLETRLDTMIELWNDFVDKNKDPFSPYQPQPPVRRPPQGGTGGGRGPYFDRDRQPAQPGRPGRTGSGRYMDRDRPGRRDMMEDDQDTPRRFRF